MRRAPRVDRNHADIVRAFRQIGATVQDLSAVGKGCPDVIVGFRNVNVLVEIKAQRDNTRESHPKLNALQVDWHHGWAGQVLVADSIEDAVKAVIAISMGRP